MKENKKREKRFLCEWWNMNDDRAVTSAVVIIVLAAMAIGFFSMVNVEKMLVGQEKYKEVINYYPEDRYEYLIKQIDDINITEGTYSFYNNLTDSTHCVIETLSIESGLKFAPDPTITVSISKNGISKELNYSSKDEYMEATIQNIKDQTSVRLLSMGITATIMILTIVILFFAFSLPYMISKKNKEKQQLS